MFGMNVKILIRRNAQRYCELANNIVLLVVIQLIPPT